MDGLYGNNEQDYDAAKIREVYHGLWRIEASFWIMKSDFDAMPIYLNKREHIRAHFIICFVALVLHPVSNRTFSTAYFAILCVVVSQRCHRIASFLRLAD